MKIGHLDLRMCPKCFSVFFPCDQTTALRGDLPDKSRELWYNALLAKNVLEVERSIAFLNSNLKDNDEVRQACLDFLAFLYTDAELAAFTQGTSMPIAMKYSLSNEQLADMTNFGRRIWDLRDNQNGSNMLYNCSVSPVYRLNFNEMCIVDGCDNFWTKFDAFGGIAGMNLSGKRIHRHCAGSGHGVNAKCKWQNAKFGKNPVIR